MNRFKYILSIIATSFFVVSFRLAAYASEPQLINGTKKLAEDATGWLTGIIAVVTIVLAIFRAIKWQTSDEQEAVAAKRKFVMTLGIGALATCTSGLVKLILSYYV